MSLLCIKFFLLVHLQEIQSQMSDFEVSFPRFASGLQFFVHRTVGVLPINLLINNLLVFIFQGPDLTTYGSLVLEVFTLFPFLTCHKTHHSQKGLHKFTKTDLNRLKCHYLSVSLPSNAKKKRYCDYPLRKNHLATLLKHVVELDYVTVAVVSFVHCTLTFGQHNCLRHSHCGKQAKKEIIIPSLFFTPNIFLPCTIFPSHPN